jgi:phage replication-related protein YjqB (UPF0714/DUF867 family)
MPEDPASGTGRSCIQPPMLRMDKYSSFEHLSANESEGSDYEIHLRPGSSGIAIISIHGGAIEPGTSEIADAVAGTDHSFYTFKGIKKRANQDLHITSTLFDEPCAIEIVSRSEAVISIHGCSAEEEYVQVGGSDAGLRECVLEKLRGAGFRVLRGVSNLRGIDGRNICNRCERRMGVQLEISKGLRAAMFWDASRGTAQVSGILHEFTGAVRAAIEQFKLEKTLFKS